MLALHIIHNALIVIIMTSSWRFRLLYYTSMCPL